MKVYFEVTSLLLKNLSSDGLYTKHLYKLLRGLGVDISPVYKVPPGIRENYIEYHLGHGASKFRPMFAAKDSVLHGPTGNLLVESDKFKRVISVNSLAMFREGMMSPALAKQLQTHLKQQVQSDLGAVIVPTLEVHNEFLVRFPKLVSKVHIVEPGCDHILDSSNLNDGRIVENPYFVFVGNIETRTNIAGVVKAFDAYCNIQSKVDLVIVGDNGFGSEAIHKLIDSSSHRQRMNLVGHKTGAQLKNIYNYALATVIPSYSEGFSFPMVESMKLGCPVIASAIASNKDVGGDAAHFVNPKDPEQIMAGLERIYVDKIYREKLIKAGQEVTQKMTWLKTAKEVASIYNKL